MKMGYSPSPQICLVLLVLGLSSGGKQRTPHPHPHFVPSICPWPPGARLHRPFSSGVSTTPVFAGRPQVPCSLEGVEIKGGSFQLLQGGQALEYLCPAGFYPYPVQTRTCRSSGSWSALQTRDQKIVKRAECRGWRFGSVTGGSGWQGRAVGTHASRGAHASGGACGKCFLVSGSPGSENST